MRDVDVVVLSRFPEIFEGFRESVDRDAPDAKKLVVWNNRDVMGPAIGKWAYTQTPEPFQIAQAANIGWHELSGDLVYVGDDVRIIEPDTIKRLQELAYSDPSIGILSPSIQGLCTMHPTPTKDAPLSFVQWVGFVFVFIKREIIERVGYLDERFEGYGFEDLDYCFRTRKAGFKIAVARDVTVKHGVDGHSYGSTFIRVRGEEQMGKDNQENMRRFAEKWGLPNETGAIFRAMEDLRATEQG